MQVKHWYEIDLFTIKRLLNKLFPLTRILIYIYIYILYILYIYILYIYIYIYLSWIVKVSLSLQQRLFSTNFSDFVKLRKLINQSFFNKNFFRNFTRANSIFPIFIILRIDIEGLLILFYHFIKVLSSLLILSKN